VDRLVHLQYSTRGARDHRLPQRRRELRESFIVRSVREGKRLLHDCRRCSRGNQSDASVPKLAGLARVRRLRDGLKLNVER